MLTQETSDLTRPLRVVLVDGDAREREAVLRALAQTGLNVDAVEAAEVERARVDAERREAEARSALARHSRRVQALVEGSERIHAAHSLEHVVEAAAAEALALFEAPGARVEIAARHRFPAIAHAAGEAVPAPLTEVPLRDPKQGPVGALTLHGVTVSELDAALLAQFARTLVSALENAWLLRLATEAARARDEVLAVVSHDLRSPLATVSLGASMLRGSLAARGEALAADLDVVRRMERACQRMARLIENLLDAAQLDGGTFVVHPQRRAAAELVMEAIDEARTAAEGARVRLHATHIDPLQVLADRDRVLQLFSNLVGNALKFTPRGGEVALSVERDGAEARFSVTDSGPGVADALVPALFQREPAERRALGRGLGLYISRGIVEAHRGRIAWRCGEGRGSVFSFTLPLAS